MALCCSRCVSQTLHLMMEQSASFHGAGSSRNGIHSISDPFKTRSSLSTAFIIHSNHQQSSLHLVHHYQNRFQTMSVRRCPLLSIKPQPPRPYPRPFIFHCCSDRADHFPAPPKSLFSAAPSCFMNIWKPNHICLKMTSSYLNID